MCTYLYQLIPVSKPKIRDYVKPEIQTNLEKLLLTSACCSSQYKFKRCSKKECCKQCRYVRFKGIITKWHVQKPTHRTALYLFFIYL